MKLRNKKTGEIIDLEQWRFEYYKGSGCIAITNDKNQDEEFCYGAFADMKDEWEDYEPAEPLIKDEKVRKAVRAWADFNGTYPIYWEDGCTLSIDHSIRIEFSERAFAYLDVDKAYTIAELCGEEEE